MVRRLRRWTLSLSLKLSVCLIGSILIVFGLLGYLHIRLHERDLEELTFATAEGVADTIKNSTRYSMMRNQRDAVFNIIQTIAHEPGINKIRIYNEDGSIRYSTDALEVGTQVDKKAEACYACHAQEQPLTRLNRPDRVRIYQAASGERILGLISPIENSPDCAGAGCHFSPAQQKVLGVLDVTLSLEKADQMIAEGRSKIARGVVIAALVISGFFGALIWAMVYRPVRQLRAGTQHVARGELDYAIEVGSRDEIGELAGSFNHMTEELRRAKEEITEWTRKLEQRVEEKTAELKKAHQRMVKVERMASMGQLAAIVAHEINNPLAGILTYARLLRKKVGKPFENPESCAQVQSDLDLIASEAARCGEIVKGLLQFSRQGKRNYQANDLNQLVRESIRLIKHKVDLMCISTELALDETLVPVVCDAQEIRQALVAVLINACEAVQPNEGVIRIGTQLRPALDSVDIWVSDNGVGMDAETQKHIFEPFFTTKEHGKGVGLGLAAVSGIINQHSGEIEVESEPAKGTRITLRLPLTSEAATAGESTKAMAL
ncbi:MAG: HAMP domain-containing protein [Acidobacteria bacterium]|nr:MAG: HAMP domain-containing protein [Acidobacteriota bacterium]